MTFKQWCEMVYEKSCGKYRKGKKRVFEDRQPHQHDRLRVVVIHDHPRPKGGI